MAGFRLQPVVKLLPWQRDEEGIARPGPTRFPFFTEKTLEFSALLDGFRLDPQNRVLYLCRFEFHRGRIYGEYLAAPERINHATAAAAE